MDVDDYLLVKVHHSDGDRLVKVHHSDGDRSALIAPASLASDHVRLFGPREDGVTPTLRPRRVQTRIPRSTPYVSLSTRTLLLIRISCTREKTEAITRLLFDHWPASRRQAKANEFLSMAGKLWNLT